MHTSTWLAGAAFLAALLSLGANTLVAAFPRATQSEVRLPLGTGFTYQGRIVIDGTPYSGTCGLRFTLWDSSFAGAPVGSNVTLTAPVSNGVFSALLNTANQFGNGAFTGEARWLETEARCPNSGPYVSLGRTQLTPVPYATFAMDAQDSERLGGFDADEYARFARIVHVRAGTDTTANGDALEAAIAGISDASQIAQVLVLLEAGTYDVDSTLVLPENVTLAGLDSETSVVRGNANPVVDLAQAASLLSVTIESLTASPAVRLPGGAASIRSSVVRGAGVGVLVPVPSTFSLLDVIESTVDVYCTGAIACTGIQLAGSSGMHVVASKVSTSAFGASTSATAIAIGAGLVTIRDSEVVAGTTGAVPATGLTSGVNLGLTLSGTSIYASTGSGAAVGIVTDAANVAVSRANVTVFTSGTATGVSATGTLSLTFSSVKVIGSPRYGVLLFGGSSTNVVEHSTVDATGSGAGSPALQSNGTTTIRHSSLMAGASSSSLFVQAGTATTLLTEFRGGSTFSTGTLTCVGSATASAFLDTGCP